MRSSILLATSALDDALQDSSRFSKARRAAVEARPALAPTHRALHAFAAAPTRTWQVGLDAGELVAVRRARADGWSEVSRAGGARGLAPTAYLEPLDGFEYNVEQCPAGTPPERCTYRYEYTATPCNTSDGPPMFTLVTAIPHVHTHVLSTELIDAETNVTLCRASRENGKLVYGTGIRAGDEAGFLVGIVPCTWDEESAPRFRAGHPLRTVAVYNASRERYGVMNQWILLASPE